MSRYRLSRYGRRRKTYGLFRVLLLVQFAGYALLVPFFGWGIYLLRRRYLYYEESTTTVEVATTAFVSCFFWVEALVLREALSGQILPFLIALLGLSIAGFALYAHVVISLLSRLVVDMVAPSNDTALHQPRFGPVDALEREEDYEAALDEYLVLARIYPRNFDVLSRTANAQLILGRPKEAVEWYLRARKRTNDPKQALEVTNQLCSLYDHEMSMPESAEVQLAEYLRDFPNSLDADIVRDRLNRRADRTDWSVSDFLEAMSDDPIRAVEEERTVPAPKSTSVATMAREAVKLVSLEAEGAAEAPLPSDVADSDLEGGTKAAIKPSKLSPMSEEPKKKKKRSASSAKSKATKPTQQRGLGLEALEDLDPKKDVAVPTPEAPKRSTLSLDKLGEE